MAEYFTERGWRKFLDKLSDILWDAEREGVVADSLPILEDIEDRITPQVKAKVLTKSEVMDEIKKILEERGGPHLISWLREKHGELPEIEAIVPVTPEEMYAEAEVRIKELEEKIKKLEEELKKHKPYVPEEVVYVHIERGWPAPNEFFEFKGVYGNYVGSVCDVIAVDKRDFESERFQSLYTEGIVTRAVITPKQAEKIKDKIKRILKDRGFRGRTFDELFREVVRLTDWSGTYDDILREASARARTIKPIVPTVTPPVRPPTPTPTAVRIGRRVELVHLPEENPLFPEYLAQLGLTLREFYASNESIQRELKRGFLYWLMEKEK